MASVVIWFQMWLFELSDFSMWTVSDSSQSVIGLLRSATPDCLLLWITLLGWITDQRNLIGWIPPPPEILLVETAMAKNLVGRNLDYRLTWPSFNTQIEILIFPIINAFLTLWTYNQSIKQTIFRCKTLLYEKENNQEVDYGPLFRLCLWSKLLNHCLTSVHFRKSMLISYTVTLKGLED